MNCRRVWWPEPVNDACIRIAARLESLAYLATVSNFGSSAISKGPPEWSWKAVTPRRNGDSPPRFAAGYNMGMEEKPSLRFSVIVAVVMLNLAYVDVLLFALIDSRGSWDQELGGLAYLTLPVFALQAGAGVIVLIACWINRRDDPSQQKRPSEHR